jgi:hypothetical protein
VGAHDSPRRRAEAQRLRSHVSGERSAPLRTLKRHFFLCYNPYSCIQAIIQDEVGVPGLKKALILLLFLLAASLMLLSCGGYSSPSGSGGGGSVKYRAFVTNNVSSGSGSAGVYIVNAATDVRALSSPISVGNTPGMMVLTPNRAQTLVFSGNGTQFSDNQFSIVNNASDAVAFHLTLPGLTESFVVSPDSSTAYVALPTAAVVGQPPGIVDAISLSNGSVTGQVEVGSVRYLTINNSGNRILGFSDNSNAVALITPSNIGIGNAVTSIGGFDRPIAAFFSSDDSVAYVLNCGAECGGQQASVQKLEMIPSQCPNGVCDPVPVPAASVALVSGSTMYLAGTPFSPGEGPSLLCSTGTTTTQATYCGLLTIFDLSTMSAINSAPIVITDGYHDRMALADNGQLFIGAHTCTEISTTETRGCLSIYNTMPTTTVGSVPPGGVLIPPENGDVTGIQPVSKRTVVYVIQGQGVSLGGSLFIYDATTDTLENNPNDPNNPGHINGLVGNFFDVKTIDF